MQRINVTKTFLPPIEDYLFYLRKIWESGQVTNQGPLLLELEAELKKNLGVHNLHFVSNGTMALQIALRALGIEEGEIITTPFSYVASVSAILWERCVPVFVDIDPKSLCIDPSKIEQAISSKTKAILAVHVFGNPCEVEKIEQVAKKHNLKIIYDGAHAFGVRYSGKSLLGYGDVSTCSFHATKLFHTVEGGCVITKDDIVGRKVELIKRFGHDLDEHFMLGINAKASELHAAIGLSNLKYVNVLINERRRIAEQYDTLLDNNFERPEIRPHTDYNYAYYPILFDTEAELGRVIKLLNRDNIFPRRYFYPSLNTLPYLENQQSCPISVDIARRILCLPLYAGLEEKTIVRICELIKP